MNRIKTFLICLILTGAASARAQAPSPAKTPPPAAKTPQAPAKARPPGIAASLGAIEGKVEIKLPGSEAWTEAQSGQALPPAAEVRTGAQSSAAVAFSDGSKIRLGPNANIKLETVSASKISVFLGLGKLEAWVTKWGRRSFQARSPVAVASVRGTVFSMEVILTASGAFEAIVNLFSGKLALSDNRGIITAMIAGQRVQAAQDKGVVATGKVEDPPPAEPEIEAPPPPTGEAAPAGEEAPAEEFPAAEETAPEDQPPPPNPSQEVPPETSPSSP